MYFPLYFSTGEGIQSSSGSGSSSPDESELSELLLQLQDEFSHLTL